MEKLNTQEVVQKTNKVSYTQEFILDVALCENDPDKYDIDFVLRAYGVSKQAFEHLKSVANFKTDLEKMKEKLLDGGYNFKLKCAQLSHDFLPHIKTMMEDPKTSDSVKEKLISNVVRWGGFEVNKGDGGGEGGPARMEVVIDLGNATSGGSISMKGNKKVKTVEQEEDDE